MSDFKNIQQRESGLKQELGARQMSMIALGGAIGTGLFLGSKFAIGFAGPSVIISYAIGGLIALLLMGALAEMTVAHATSGSFGAYAEYYVGPLAGFLVRYLYWSCIVLAVGTEVTAIGEYMQFWFADVPQWIWIVGFSAVLIGVNMFNVKAFGTMEYWFSTIKVFAIVAFIIMAAYVVFGSGNPDYGFHNYTSGGGFMPNGFSGMWFAVIVSIFSYLSIEMIAIAAGEAENPAVAVKKAFRVTIVRLFVFYIATLGLIVAIAPMDKILSGGSPFVTVMQVVNIPGADSVLNFVVIIAALSAMNSQLYVSSRMMFSLSRAGDAPKILGKVRANGSPVNALLLSTSGIAVATLVYALFPDQSFTLMISLSMFGAMATWLLIFVTHWFFRKRMKAEGTKLSFIIPGFPFGTILGGGLMVAILVTTLWADSFEMTLVFGIPFVLAAIAIFYLTRSRRARSQALNADQVEDEITGTVVKRVP